MRRSGVATRSDVVTVRAPPESLIVSAHGLSATPRAKKFCTLSAAATSIFGSSLSWADVPGLGVAEAIAAREQRLATGERASAGQANGRRPLKSRSGLPPAPATSTSAMPSPCVPGSQAATNASDALISGETNSGRPDRNTETTGTPAAFSLRSSARSVASLG